MFLNYLYDMNYILNRTSFLADSKNFITTVDGNRDLKAGATSYVSSKKACLAGIGELFERERFMINTKRNNEKLRNDKILGYSLVDNKIVEVKKNKVFFNYDNIVDSCGIASHTNSYDCIRGALEEFIERQSYILNYLSKSGGVQIDCNNIDSFKFAFKRYGSSNLKFFNISIINEFYVILGKAYYDNRFYIGLGASNNIKSAIMKCINEIKQLEINYKNRIIDSWRNTEKIRYSDYNEIFIRLNPIKIKEAYNYLEEKSTKAAYLDNPNVKYSMEKLIKDLHDNYSMNPIIVSLGTLRNKNIKIVKIIDQNWFENMNVKSYDSRKLDFIERVTNKKLDRNCTFLPFT